MDSLLSTPPRQRQQGYPHGDIGRLAHSVWDCKYHIMFIPKCLRKRLYGDLRRDLGEVFRRLARQKESEIEEGHPMPDHVHMVIAIPPRWARAGRRRGLTGRGRRGMLGLRQRPLENHRMRAAALRLVWAGALLSWATSASADYSPPAFYDMVGASPLIVVGEIVSLDAKTFEINVLRTVAGERPSPSSTLRIRRFKDWTCSARWAPYTTGQRVLLFLRRDERTRKETGTPWVIRSAGGEGEMPIDRTGDVILRGISVPGMKAAPVPLHGGTVIGSRVVLADFVRVIQRFRACFHLRTKAKPWLTVRGVDHTCSATEVSALRDSHPAAKTLVEEVVRNHPRAN